MIVYGTKTYAIRSYLSIALINYGTDSQTLDASSEFHLSTKNYVLNYVENSDTTEATYIFLSQFNDSSGTYTTSDNTYSAVELGVNYGYQVGNSTTYSSEGSITINGVTYNYDTVLQQVVGTVNEGSYNYNVTINGYIKKVDTEGYVDSYTTAIMTAMGLTDEEVTGSHDTGYVLKAIMSNGISGYQDNLVGIRTNYDSLNYNGGESYTIQSSGKTVFGYSEIYYSMGGDFTVDSTASGTVTINGTEHSYSGTASITLNIVSDNWGESTLNITEYFTA